MYFTVPYHERVKKGDIVREGVKNSSENLEVVFNQKLSKREIRKQYFVSMKRTNGTIVRFISVIL